MSAPPQFSALAPFHVRSFRFQWPADLATSWAFEMETLVLGWYILVETGSVQMLTLFGALQFMGTLVSPMFGVAGDRIGHRNLLCIMRAFYATLAAILMALAFAGLLTPVAVFVVVALFGLVRPSDLAMRHALVAETMPPGLLMGGMGISRTTGDSARIAGALAGAGLFATLGMGPTYVVIVLLYVTSVLLTRQVSHTRAAHPAAAIGDVPAPSSWRDLREGLAYVRRTPLLLASMGLAFLLNLTAFPLLNGLQPYVAREIYHTDQTGLGYMVASTAFGALLGSIVASRLGSAARQGRLMLTACVCWYGLLLVYSHLTHPAAGIPVLMLTGFVQSVGQVTMATLLLRHSAPQFRGRVMGIRMLAIYGLPIGLLVSGPLIGRFGYPVTAIAYCLVGLAFTLLIALRWRAHLWRRDAPVNRG
ncbi:MAG: MFS transporter [Burkholderiales bacterium]